MRISPISRIGGFLQRKPRLIPQYRLERNANGWAIEMYLPGGGRWIELQTFATKLGAEQQIARWNHGQ